MPHIPYKPRPLPDDQAGFLAPSLPPSIPRPDKPAPVRREKVSPPEVIKPDNPARHRGKLGIPVLSLSRHELSPAAVFQKLFG
jgi:hypothetical protein